MPGWPVPDLGDVAIQLDQLGKRRREPGSVAWASLSRLNCSPTTRPWSGRIEQVVDGRDDGVGAPDVGLRLAGTYRASPTSGSFE